MNLDVQVIVDNRKNGSDKNLNHEAQDLTYIDSFWSILRFQKETPNPYGQYWWVTHIFAKIPNENTSVCLFLHYRCMKDATHTFRN